MDNRGYNYIWYPLTNFVEIPSNNFKFCLSEVLSPYTELNLEAMNGVKNNLESMKHFGVKADAAVLWDTFTSVVGSERMTVKK